MSYRSIMPWIYFPISQETRFVLTTWRKHFLNGIPHRMPIGFPAPKEQVYIGARAGRGGEYKRLSNPSNCLRPTCLPVRRQRLLTIHIFLDFSKGRFGHINEGREGEDTVHQWKEYFVPSPVSPATWNTSSMTIDEFLKQPVSRREVGLRLDVDVTGQAGFLEITVGANEFEPKRGNMARIVLKLARAC